MQAIILAAGMGKRLGELTSSNTKCMIKVNGVTLIERMLGQLDLLKLDRIVIVIGYESTKLKNFISELSISTKIDYIENNIYYKTNNIYSLYLAKHRLLEDDTLLLESDLIFDFSVLQKLTNCQYPSIALVAKFESWMDGTVVKLDEDNNIRNFISTKHFKFEEISSYFKTVNIYKFSKSFSQTHYVPFLEAYCSALGNNEYYEQVLKVITLLDKPEIKALQLENEQWYEIDDMQDLDIAESVFASEDERLKKIQLRYGGYWRYPSLLDFCYLVNPFFPCDKLKDEIKANFDRIISEYPSGLDVNNLLAAKYFSINKNYICVGNGAAELIKSLLNKNTDNVGIPIPTFEEYTNRIEKSKIISFDIKNDDFSYNAEDLINFYNDKRISTLILINPDNPSGNFIPFDEILTLLEWTKIKKIKLIIDESFVDFSDDSVKNTLLQDHLLLGFPNLVVIKSISKSYGVPGLRLGVLATSNQDLITYIKKDVSIWNINSFAEFYLQIFGKYSNIYIDSCDLFRSERFIFFKALTDINFLRVIPSQANYFLCEILPPYKATEVVKQLLVRFNILVKDCSNKRGFQGKNYIRISIRNNNDNDYIIKCLTELASGHGNNLKEINNK